MFVGLNVKKIHKGVEGKGRKVWENKKKGNDVLVPVVASLDQLSD